MMQLNKTYLPLILLFIFLLHTAPAGAQENLPLGTSSDEQPIEISADETLEWNRAEKQYIARGNVVVIQGDKKIKADMLIADYRETEEKSVDMYQLTAIGNVSISANNSTALGDKAIYNLDKALAEMTGENLKLIATEQTVTAKERFEYWVDKGELIARGSPRVIRENNTLTANTLSAIFADTQEGKREIEKMQANGNVVITTPDEILRGANALYIASNNTASLQGNVEITRGKNKLNGQKAEVNLTTNVSRIFGGEQNGGRVRGVFYPGSAGKSFLPE